MSASADTLELIADVQLSRVKVHPFPGQAEHLAFPEPEYENEHECGIKRVICGERRR